MFKFKRKDKGDKGDRESVRESVRGSHKLLSTRSSSKLLSRHHHHEPEPEPAKHKRVDALEQARQARFNSTATTMLADADDAYYHARAQNNGTDISTRSDYQLHSARSTSSSVMSYDDDEGSNYSGYSGYSGYSSSSARSTDTYRSTTNGTARATENLRATGLETLNENEEDSVDRSTAKYVGAGADLAPAMPTARATTPKAAAAPASYNYNYPSPNVSSATSDALLQELAEMKQEMQAIRREMMNEMHLTRYDVLKEVTMLKGTITQLVSILQQSGGAHFDAAAAAVMGVEQPPPTPELSADEIATMSRRTTTVASKTTKERITTTREDMMPPLLRTTSARLTQLAPVDDSALSTPLDQEQIDDMFPLIDASADVQVQARIRDDGTREWVFDRVQEWLDSRFNVGSDVVLAIVGDAGTGKTVAAAAVSDKHHEQVVAQHFCKFEKKAKSSPRNVLLSMVNQLTTNVPTFKSQLARLNLKYVLEETDVLALARKVLVDPLNSLEEPLTAMFILIDGIDQCGIPNGYNDLLDFFSVIVPECPSWLGFLITTKPSPEFAQKIPVTSLLGFSGKNAQYVNDTVLLINDIVAGFSDEDQQEAKQILKAKSLGNYSYLEFTKQALSGMHSPEESVPVDVLHDLPQSLYEIYEEIFEDKFGKGRTRLWRKALPVLQLIFTAASGPYAQITEQHVMDSLSYSKDDVRMLRRAFVDIISIRHGTYHIVSSALFDWLTDAQRKGEDYHVDVTLHVKVLRRVLRGEKLNLPGTAHGATPSNTNTATVDRSSSRSLRSSPSSTESSSSNSSSDRTSEKTGSARVVSTAQAPPKLHEPNFAPREKPVGILKRRA